METKTLIARRDFSRTSFDCPDNWTVTLRQVGAFYEVKVTRLNAPGGSLTLTHDKEAAVAEFNSAA